MKPELQRITAATTKVRRLGYFVLFSKILSQNPLPPLLLQQHVLAEENRNHKLLEDACKEQPVSRKKTVVTGEIRSSDAFMRYLGTAMEFGLIQKLSGRLYNTKRGEILAALIQNENLFKLSIAQNYLMWKVVLEKDYDYIRNVILCTINDRRDEHIAFFSSLKELWQQKLKDAKSRNVDAYDGLKKAIGTKWNSQLRYYKENIKAPRLEWLLDLNAIEFWHIGKNRVLFRDSIKTLLDSSESNFSNAFISYMEPILKKPKTYWSEILMTKKSDLLEKILVQSFDLFKARDTIPKISANQFLEFGVANLSGYGIICEIGELDDSLERFIKSKTDKYRYVRIVSEADTGYISEF